MTSYTHQLFADNFPPGIERNFWNLARNRIIGRTLHRLGLGPASILDVGCGRGIVVEALREQGFDCLGVEPGAPSLSGNGREFIHTGVNAENLPETVRQRIKVLMLCDVIEHLPEPVPFLGNLVRAFPAATHLLITVPAGPELWSNHDEHFGHYRRYTPASLKAELAAASITDIAAMQNFFHLLYPGLRAATLLGMKRPIKDKIFDQFWLHEIAGTILEWESLLLPGFLPGTSLLAVARLPRNTP